MDTVERITDPNIISFPKLGWEFSIDPTAFSISGVDIQWYGIIITFGLILAMLYCFPKMKRFGINSDR
ncbi:MAG: prolipoprotein diacylglyceryl transferase family protein, partial [Ruminococcus sp.]